MHNFDKLIIFTSIFIPEMCINYFIEFIKLYTLIFKMRLKLKQTNLKNKKKINTIWSIH